MQSFERNGQKLDGSAREPLVLFYTNIARSFRSDLIGYLYEIAQSFPVVLISEDLDPETDEVIRNKELFPGIKEIIKIRQYDGNRTNLGNLLSRHRNLSKEAKRIASLYKPDIVFATGCNVFESYLRRFAKKNGAITISGTGPLFLVQPEGIQKFKDSDQANSKFPGFLPRSVRVFLVKYRRYLAHTAFYWIAPLFILQKPFFKEPSCILWDVENLNGADYYYVWLREDYDILAKKNAPLGKLFVLSNSLCGKGRKIFEILTPEIFDQGIKREKKNLAIMWPNAEVTFKRGSFFQIPKKEMQEGRARIARLISGVLSDWEIFIKPHPLVKDTPSFKEMVEMLAPISDRINIVDPFEPAEEYTAKSDVIVGLSPASASIFTASLLCPEKPILSIDLYEEFSGDVYKNLQEIEYINSESKLIETLKLIKNGNYRKKISQKTEDKGFKSAVEAIKWILNKEQQ